MGKKKTVTPKTAAKPKTTADLAAEFFEREKAAYENRTGETVHYVPGVPVEDHAPEQKNVEQKPPVPADDSEGSDAPAGDAAGDETNSADDTAEEKEEAGNEPAHQSETEGDN